jgi:hypothetical protein
MNLLELNKKLAGISLISLGLFIILYQLNIVAVETEKIFGMLIVLCSSISVYIFLDKNERAKLALSVIIFFVGVLFLVESYYEILTTRGIVFTSILFINGGIFLILFIDNSKEKIFLSISLLSFFLSFLSYTILRKMGLFELANKIANLLEIFWPVILLVMGIGIFINRKK